MSNTARPAYAPHALLTPGEAAGLLRVHPKTVTRYAHEGKIPTFKTPGGHHRIYYAAIIALLVGDDPWDSCQSHGLPLPPRPTETLRGALDNSAAGNVADLGDFTQYATDNPTT